MKKTRVDRGLTPLRPIDESFEAGLKEVARRRAEGLIGDDEGWLDVPAKGVA